MTPIVRLYWLRVALGITAGAITAGLAPYMGSETDISTLLNCISIAIIIYFISYYILKGLFQHKVEKQSKILTTGIGMYFFAWIAFFVLFYTFIRAFLG